jgi:beta-mannosidase
MGCVLKSRVLLTLLLAVCGMILPGIALGGDQLPNPYGASEERLASRVSTSQQIDLTGKWQMAGQDPDAANPFGSDKPRTLPDMKGWQFSEVTVPGSIRSGLLETGAIDDPYWSDNAGKSLWTEKKDWWFRKTVTVPKAWAGRRIYLGFDGVDYYSSVWVNGKFLGDHEGMYGGPVHDVTKLICFGEPNEIVVDIHTGGTDEPGKIFKGYIFLKWHYLTDISPRGIWRGARVVATGPVRLENPFVRTVSVSDKQAELEISLDVVNPGDAAHVLLSGTVTGDNCRTTKIEFSIPVDLKKGSQTVTHRLNVPSPKLWWPAGMGDPNLYRLELNASADGHVSDSVSATFGIRTLECEVNPGLDSDQNNRFMYKINGKLIAMRGAGGFGINDQIYRCHARKDAWFIKVAERLNYNFIRVHGAGVVASDEFYDLCDRMGMMVWQEFMVSNMGLSGVHQDVWRGQTVQSVLRLRNHPSLIRWCGGNEFNPDSTDNENKTIVDMFEQCVAKYDGTRLFSRASQYVNDPHYNDESGTYGGFKPAACTEYGGLFDGTIIGERSLRKFLPAEDVTRWPPATKEKLDQFLAKDLLPAWDNTRRGAFLFHTAVTGRCDSWGWLGDLTGLLPQWAFFGTPRTMDEAFDVSQVSGGLTTSYVIDTFRSRWPHPSLYAGWDYAPIWPMSIVWGPIDYYGNLLPCAYYYKRAQEPLHVLMQFASKQVVRTPVIGLGAYPKIYAPGDTFTGEVSVASDLDHPIGAHTAGVKIYDSKLDLMHEDSLKMTAMPSGPASLHLGTVKWEVPKSTGSQTALVCVSLVDAAGKVVSRSAYPIWISSDIDKLVSDPASRRELSPRLTDMKKAQTVLSMKVISRSVSFTRRDYLPAGKQLCAQAIVEISNTGNKPAFHAGVEIDNADCRYVCDDNYFVLMPGERKRVTFEIDRSTQPFYEYVKQPLIQPMGKSLQFKLTAWNAPAQIATVAVDE